MPPFVCLFAWARSSLQREGSLVEHAAIFAPSFGCDRFDRHEGRLTVGLICISLITGDLELLFT